MGTRKPKKQPPIAQKLIPPPPPPPKFDPEDLYDFDGRDKPHPMFPHDEEYPEITSKKLFKEDILKIVARENRNPQDCVLDDWTKLLLEMANIQVAAMKAKQKTARVHWLAILKELEYHIGFRFQLINSETCEDDPRKK